MGFHFARELWESLRVPVGLINCSHGNSPVEGWMSPEALAGEPEFKAVADRWAEVMAKHPAASARYEAAVKQWQADSEAARAAGKKRRENRVRPSARTTSRSRQRCSTA